MENLIYQQGDCLLKRCGNNEYFIGHKSIPESAKKVKGNLLLKGQTNSHALYGGKFQLFEHEKVTFLKVEKTTKLDHVQDHTVKKPKHAEHHAQEILPGEYFLDAVLEFDHFLEESRQVVD